MRRPRRDLGHRLERDFNPRTRTGCDKIYELSNVSPAKFQSTHPHRVRPSSSALATRMNLFQSTHPHRVRPHRHREPGSAPEISIHAPAQGATEMRSMWGHGVRISIHAPAQGATFFLGEGFRREGFQSTHPHRVRRVFAAGAIAFKNFNPRTRTGCDRKVL